MPDDIGALLAVSLEARLTRFEASLKRAEQLASGSMAVIETRVAQAKKRMEDSLSFVRLTQQLDVARASGNKDAVVQLEREVKVRQTIAQLQKAGVKDLVAARAEAEKYVDALAGGGAKAHGGGLGSSRMALMELEHSARASIDAIAAGASPLRVLAMEGPRVAQALGNTPGGLAGVLGVLTGLVNPLTVTLGALAGAFAVGAISAIQYASGVHEVEKAVQGLKNISGLTTDQIVGNAERLAQGSKHGVSEIMSIQAQLISTGAVASGQLEAATTLIEHFTDRTNGNLKEVAKLFAQAFTDPAQGAKTLGSEYGFLTKAEADHIEKLEEQQGKIAALSQLLAVLNKNLPNVTTKLYEQKKGWDAIAESIGGAWQKLGDWLARAAHISETKADQVAAIDAQLKTTDTSGPAGRVVRDRLLARKAQLLADQNREEAEAQRVGNNRKAAANTFRPKVPKTKAAPQDRTVDLDGMAHEALDAAYRAVATALHGLAVSIDERASAERDQINADTDKQLEDLTRKEQQVRQAKVDAHRDEQLKLLEKARAETELARTARLELVERNRVISLIQQSAEIVRQDNELKMEALRREEERYRRRARLASGPRQEELERAALATQQERERREADSRVQAALAELAKAGQSGDRTAIEQANERYLAAKDSRSDLARDQGLENDEFRRRFETPLNRWVREADDASQSVERSLEGAAVKGLDRFNEGIAEAVANGRNMGDVFKSVFREMEAELIRYLLKQAEVGVVNAASSAGGALAVASSLLHLIPGFASGTDSAPGGIALVGENGPELVNLAKGSSVITNANVRAMTAVPRLSASSTTLVQPISFDLRGAVVTEDLMRQMDQKAAAAAQAGAAMGHQRTMARLQQRSRNTL